MKHAVFRQPAYGLLRHPCIGKGKLRNPACNYVKNFPAFRVIGHIPSVLPLLCSVTGKKVRFLHVKHICQFPESVPDPAVRIYPPYFFWPEAHIGSRHLPHIDEKIHLCSFIPILRLPADQVVLYPVSAMVIARVIAEYRPVVFSAECLYLRGQFHPPLQMCPHKNSHPACRNGRKGISPLHPAYDPVRRKLPDTEIPAVNRDKVNMYRTAPPVPQRQKSLVQFHIAGPLVLPVMDGRNLDAHHRYVVLDDGAVHHLGAELPYPSCVLGTGNGQNRQLAVKSFRQPGNIIPGRGGPGAAQGHCLPALCRQAAGHVRR